MKKKIIIVFFVFIIFVNRPILAKTDDVIAHDVINQMQTDVNTASAEELATPPGINIVMAKRAVQFRDTKRYFKDKDDFFEISGVKEHFRDKIAQIITVNQPKTKPQTGGGDDERIVDI